MPGNEFSKERDEFLDKLLKAIMRETIQGNRMKLDSYVEITGDELKAREFYSDLFTEVKGPDTRIIFDRVAELSLDVAETMTKDGKNYISFKSHSADVSEDATIEDPDGRLEKGLILNCIYPDFRNDYAISEVSKLRKRYNTRKKNDEETEKESHHRWKRLSEIEKEDVEFLIPGYIVNGALNVIAAEGGIGKSTIWGNIAASVTSGRPSILESEVPFDITREKKNVIIISGEESVSAMIKQRIINAGGDENRIIALDITSVAEDGTEWGLPSFGDKKIEDIISEEKPALVIFDPVQTFLPDNCRIADRGDVRKALTPLVRIAQENKTAIIIINHANKVSGTWGRRRMADSAEFYDTPRSVLMIGETETKGIKYISHEKCNVAPHSPTILFSIDENGCAKYEGTTDKTDRDYQLTVAYAQRHTLTADTTEETLLSELDAAEGNKMLLSELDESLLNAGCTRNAIRMAKESLQTRKLIIRESEGFGSSKKWYIKKA